MKALRILMALACALSLASVAGSSATADEGGRMTAYVVNYPLQYFAERVSGGQAEIVLPSPSGEDPAYWTPGADVVSDFQQADMIILNGAGYAKWVANVSLPRAKMVNTSRGFSDRFISSEEIATHTHGPDGDHAHENLAFTTWLDFELALLQARAITDAMERKMPERGEALEENFTVLAEDLTDLDRRISEVVAGDPSRPLVASHPVYQYFARRYGLNMRSVHWEPDEAPSPEQWSELQALLKAHPAEWMIWEGEPSTDVVAALQKMGVQSLVFDPAGNAPAEGDFLSVMEQNVVNLERAFRSPD